MGQMLRMLRIRWERVPRGLLLGKLMFSLIVGREVDKWVGQRRRRREGEGYMLTVRSKAVTEGHYVKDDSKKGFKAVAVSTDISPPASPCGMCRQL
jgi:hypothetical protein